MDRIRLIIFAAVLLVAIVFLVAGGFMTSHRHYSRFGKAVAPYDAADPVLIREFSFA